MSYLSLLRLAAPECVVVFTALAVLALDLVTMRGQALRVRFQVAGLFACLGCAAAAACLLVLPADANVYNGMWVSDPAVRLVKLGVLAMTAFTVVLSLDSDFTEHIGEYLVLVLLAAVGMMLLAGTENVLMLFIALELTSLSLYILTAFDKHDRHSAEAALKYFLFGGMAAAFTLFGLSLLYGLTGSIRLQDIAAGAAAHPLDPLLLVAIVMVVIGFGFKIAAVPFHLWAPDAYQGAPTPVAAFIASGSKVASFFVFAKVMMLGFRGAEGNGGWQSFDPGWTPVIAVVAVLSMVLGNLAAIVQSNVRRLLAYSAIAHAGYLLLAVMAHSYGSLGALMYYAITYGITTIGAFAVVAQVERSGSEATMSAFAGLSRRAPLLSFCLLVFILSLAGIPPLAGFFAKFYVFTAALRDGAPRLGMLWLVLVALATSAISLYYYLQVLKQVYVADPPEDAAPVPVSWPGRVLLCALAALVILLGCFPALLAGPIENALRALAP
ncbi:MAG: NADH-quinone oxidoreductase subunit N [Verrucomicrobiota bacterium]